jgi:polyvinyl alcohol dehydrogenase (cytochrome)
MTYLSRARQLAAAAALAGAVAVPGAAGAGPSWPMSGQNLSNTRNQPAERAISPATAARLVPRWVATTGGNVSATPAVVGNAVYFPDWGGNLFRLDAATGRVVWQHQIAEYNGIPGSVSRTGPAVDGNTVVVGSQKGGDLIAVSARTGALRWVTRLDAHPDAVVTQSPVVANGVVYAGVSSMEESSAANPAYACCTFRGSVVALDEATGRILWKTYMVPDNHGQPGGYSGGAVWGSTPVVDATRGSLYVTTGNNYTVPESVKACQEANPGASTCVAPDDYFDSVVALDLATGGIKWGRRVMGYDAWTVACLGLPPGVTWCPSPAGPDYDFGSGPNLFTATVNGQPRTLLGAGQKSGVYWALDPGTGAIVWSTLVGPGAALGGIQWGSATDGNRVYVAVSNFNRQQYTLQPSGQTWNAGSWSALDAATGRILWQTPDPLAASDMGMVSVANGVVFAGSDDPTGTFYALDAASGQILWRFASGGSTVAGPAIVQGRLYWGSGYNIGTPNNKLYAFCVRGETC